MSIRSCDWEVRDVEMILDHERASQDLMELIDIRRHDQLVKVDESSFRESYAETSFLLLCVS